MTLPSTRLTINTPKTQVSPLQYACLLCTLLIELNNCLNPSERLLTGNITAIKLQRCYVLLIQCLDAGEVVLQGGQGVHGLGLRGVRGLHGPIRGDTNTAKRLCEPKHNGVLGQDAEL